MKHYLLKTVDTYRVGTVAEVEALHEELKNDIHYTLTNFSYKTKYIKSKGEILDEYQVVQATKVFNDEKEPDTSIEIDYKVD